MALYTTTLKEYLDAYESSTEWTAIVNRFATIPTFNILGQSIDAYNMFKRKYLEREIGSETDQKFARFINMQLDVAILEFVPKISAFLTNYSVMFDKQIKTTKSGTEKTDHSDNHTGSYRDAGSIASNDLLNPVTSTATKLKDRLVTDQDISRTFNNDKHTVDHDITFDWTIKQDLDMSNPELIELAQKCKNYYNEFIDSFDYCFMGIY